MLKAFKTLLGNKASRNNRPCVYLLGAFGVGDTIDFYKTGEYEKYLLSQKVKISRPVDGDLAVGNLENRFYVSCFENVEHSNTTRDGFTASLSPIGFADSICSNQAGYELDQEQLEILKVFIGNPYKPTRRIFLNENAKRIEQDAAIR
jgi:hypothetical protein